MQSHKERRNTNISNRWEDQRKVNNELWLQQTFTEHKDRTEYPMTEMYVRIIFALEQFIIKFATGF